MRVLVTGGSGFLGSHIVERLLARGDDVAVIDNFATGRRDNLKPHPKLTLTEGDIADGALVEGAFAAAKPSLVVHAAASYKDPNDWIEDARTNVVGTANVVKAAERHDVKRLLYFQTSLCYGLRPAQQPVPLDAPLDPRASSYAITKTAAEHILGLSKIETISFRLANAYGPRNISGPLPTFFLRLTTGLACHVVDTRRDFIFVDDLVNVVMGAIDGAGERGSYHIATGGDVSIKELFEALTTTLGIKLDKPVEVRPRPPDDAATILLDPTKTIGDFKWQPRVSLAEGVARAVKYYQEHGIKETFTHLKGMK